MRDTARPQIIIVALAHSEWISIVLFTKQMEAEKLKRHSFAMMLRNFHPAGLETKQLKVCKAKNNKCRHVCANNENGKVEPNETTCRVLQPESFISSSN